MCLLLGPNLASRWGSITGEVIKTELIRRLAPLWNHTQIIYDHGSNKNTSKFNTSWSWVHPEAIIQIFSWSIAVSQACNDYEVANSCTDSSHFVHGALALLFCRESFSSKEMSRAFSSRKKRLRQPVSKLLRIIEETDLKLAAETDCQNLHSNDYNILAPAWRVEYDRLRLSKTIAFVSHPTLQ